ncbi:hypothetical protein BDQ17DRAFT_1430425 [Cyathus striatus]|nr:hypothetical protein BDQ17DRAFT_1430425 [Cyathus striatus]
MGKVLSAERRTLRSKPAPLLVKFDPSSCPLPSPLPIPRSAREDYNMDDVSNRPRSLHAHPLRLHHHGHVPPPPLCCITDDTAPHAHTFSPLPILCLTADHNAGDQAHWDRLPVGITRFISKDLRRRLRSAFQDRLG